MNPKWSAVDVDIELATLRDWDKRTILGFLDTKPLVPPARLVAPSLVVLAEKSLLITERVAAQLRGQGMTVATVEGTGHTVFRDDHSGFMDTVVGWLRSLAPTGVEPARVLVAA
jgi:pimeloyl-ACP methyl ester carboxylesterase